MERVSDAPPGLGAPLGIAKSLEFDGLAVPSLDKTEVEPVNETAIAAGHEIGATPWSHPFAVVHLAILDAVYVELDAHRRPVSSNITRIRTTTPSAPLGQGPQAAE